MAGGPTETIDIVLAGTGERGQAWLDTIARSRRLRLAGVVTRVEPPSGLDVPTYRTLSEALEHHPAASYALALPPRAGLEGARILTQRGLKAVVEAPLHDSLCESDLPGTSDGVKVAHGWATLPGRRAVEKLLKRMRRGRISIEVAGLPESADSDVGEALVHGLALIRSLVPDVSVAEARRAPGALFVGIESNAWAITLKLWAHGRRLAVRVEGRGESATWAWEDDRETVTLGGRTLIPSRTVPSGAERALAQLVTGEGDGLAEAAEVLRLKRDAGACLAGGIPAPGRPLKQSASIAERRPDDLLGRLGLRGQLPSHPGETPTILDPPLPDQPFELWAFRAGLKPVVFLTVEPAEVERTLGWFGDVHCERRERLVSVSAQDRWDDRRDQGETRVELYLSRDPALARRAAHLQAEVDPSEAIGELGELVGYPPCCVEAFAEQEDRANNSLNRYCSWSRTVASQPAPSAPWPWQLNNLYTVVAPFYPCSYRCERALQWSVAALREMEREHPEETAALRSMLARPVLYFDHDHQLVLDGRANDGIVEYGAVALCGPPSRELARFAALVGSGDRLLLEDGRLRIERDRSEVASFDRTDPALGFVAPFG